MDLKATVCLKSELDLFTTKPVQLAIDNSAFIEIHPVTPVVDKSQLEFFIPGNGDHYLDLAHSILHLQIKIVKKNNAVIEITDHVAPINYILNTMFSECIVFLNDTQVSCETNYAYRAIIESLFFSSKFAQDTLLGAALFHKDTAYHRDIAAVAGANVGFVNRMEACKLSKLVDIIEPHHIDLVTQPKLLINGVGVLQQY